MKKQNTLNNSLLIIASGSDKDEGKIEKLTPTEIKSKHYGTHLYNAYQTAYEIGVNNIYVVNIRTFTGYIDIIRTLMHYSFTYIVPVGIKISDTFVNKQTGKRSNFLNEYINTISKTTNSVFMYTDEHASLYEDIDDYLVDQYKKIEYAKNLVVDRKELSKHCFVLNNLVQYPYSNVVLASAILSTKVGSYPLMDFGETVFDLNDFDVSYSTVYFKNNTNIPSSIENAVNLRDEPDAYKDLLVQRVINYIKQDLDLSKYRSMLYTARVRMSVYEKARDYFISITGSIIRDFQIKDLYFRKMSPGEGILILEVDILPINFAETATVSLEV